MMALGITAWVTSRKWTLGPSYVNNSRVIETLPPVTGGRHQPPPPTVSIGQYSPVTLWPGLGDHLTTSEMATPHQYPVPRAEASSVIGGDTITVFCHNYPPHERLLLGRGIGATKNKQRRGMCCYLWHGTMCPGRGMVTAQMTTDHRH